MPENSSISGLDTSSYYDSNKTLIENSGIFSKKENIEDLNRIIKANGIYNRSDIQWYEKFNRFGCMDPFNALNVTREYIFFTKPDLHIVKPGTMELNPQLQAYPFFIELLNRYPDVILQLQKSAGGDTAKKIPFMVLLSNGVKNSLDLPSITSNVIDTAANIYGTSINYRGTGYNSDEKFDFSLEFEDTKWLEIYHLFKAYEEYERLKHLGIITPPPIGVENYDYNSKICGYYTRNKILHDQFAIYKIVVGEDMSTIVYYSKMWGVMPKSVPREAFSDIKSDGGMVYAVEFECAFVDDMNPTILSEFNNLVMNATSEFSSLEDCPVYDPVHGLINGDWARYPVIMKTNVANMNPGYWLGPTNMKYEYLLKWRK